MSLNYTISPRIEAGSLTITSEEQHIHDYQHDYTYDYTFYGWKDIVEHPLWRFHEATWKEHYKLVNVDGTEYEADYSHSMSAREYSSTNSSLFDGVTVTRVGESGTQTETYTIRDLVFTFVHSQTGKIIRSEHGKIMRSADGIILRDN